MPSTKDTHQVSDDDRSDSISLSLQCEVCKCIDNDSTMLICDSCNKGYHTYCLQPMLFSIPHDPWYCGDCGGDTQTDAQASDITEDQHVLEYLATGASPAWSLAEKNHVSKRARNYCLDSHNSFCRRPVLSHGKEYPVRPVLGKTARQDAIAGCHDLGHYGIMRTAALIAERYYWGGITQDCQAYIQKCHDCKLQNARFHEPQQMQSIPVTDQSFHRVGINLVGPLQQSTSGNQYITVAMDY